MNVYVIFLVKFFGLNSTGVIHVCLHRDTTNIYIILFVQFF